MKADTVMPNFAIALRFMALLWIALAINWFGDEAWRHAGIDLTLGVACFIYAERLDRRYLRHDKEAT